MNGQKKVVNFEEDDLKFFWDFDGASLEGVDRLGPQWYFLNLRKDTWFWFYFKISGCKGRQIIFEAVSLRADTGGLMQGKRTPFIVSGQARTPFYSYNNRDFQPIDYAESDSHEDLRVRYIHTFTEDEAYICFGIPYTTWRMEEYIGKVEMSEFVKSSVLGHTRTGLPITALTITDFLEPDENKQGVILLGREDQDETSAQYAYEGFINGLLSDEYDWLRKKTVFWTVPVVTLDAQKTGAQYSAGFGYASNRWDGNPLIPDYIKHIKTGIEGWVKSGVNLVMAGKFHSPGIWDTQNRGTMKNGVISYANAGKRKPSYCMSERYDVIEALCRHLENGAEEKSSLEKRPVGRFERYISDTYGVSSVWCVEIMADNVESARRQGSLMLRGIAQWLEGNEV